MPSSLGSSGLRKTLGQLDPVDEGNPSRWHNGTTQKTLILHLQICGEF